MKRTATTKTTINTTLCEKENVEVETNLAEFRNVASKNDNNDYNNDHHYVKVWLQYGLNNNSAEFRGVAVKKDNNDSNDKKGKTTNSTTMMTIYYFTRIELTSP